MTIYELIKDQQHRERLKEILQIFFEEEFGYLISKIKLHTHLPFYRRIKARVARERAIEPALRLRQAFERLGPTFIKFGQLLSLRPDLLPPEYIDEFEKMQDHVRPFSHITAKKIIENELGKPINKIFSYFPEKPIASASIAQVYRAKIGKNEVAVKVQRPEIGKIIRNDIEIMYKLADLLEYHVPVLKDFHLKGIVHEFEKWTIKELNFRIEALYAKRIAQNFKNSKVVKIPQIYTDFSTSKVLVMEFIDGIPLHNIEEIKKKKINLKKVIRNGYFIILKQVFVDGFFHADPHPGNILVLPDGRIGLIDFGILGHFDRKLKRCALDLFQTFVNNDPDKAIAVLLRMNPTADIDRKALSDDVRDIFEQLLSTPADDLQIGLLIKETLSKANKHHLNIPADFVLYGKTVIIVEGIAIRYQPDFNFFNETQTILKKLLNREYLTREIIDRTKSKFSEYKELIELFPETANEIMEKARRFKLNIDVEDADVRSLTAELERSSGNVALGFMTAALIIASGLIIQTDKPALISILGFVISGVLGMWLIKRTIFFKLKNK